MRVFTPHSDQEQSVTAEATGGTEFTAMDQDGLIFLWQCESWTHDTNAFDEASFHFFFFAMRKPICFS